MQKARTEQEEMTVWFTTCYDNYADAIFRFCLVKTSSHDVALDISQEVFTKLWDHVREGKEYKPEKIDNVRALLFTIARNSIIDHYRKKKTDSLEPLIEAGIEPVASENTAHAAEYDEALTAIHTLEEPYQEAVYLRYVEELPPREIARITGEKVNTVSIRITRGMKQLRAGLDTKKL